MKHFEGRNRVCFSCFKKVKINETIESSTKLVQDRITTIIPSLDLNDDRVPLGLCPTCRLKLKAVENGKLEDFDLTRLNAYLLSQARPSPRAECTCQICTIAGSSGIKTISPESKPGRPKEKEEEIVYDCCGTCFTPKYPGCSHKCNATSLHDNFIAKAPVQVQNRVASTVAKRVAEETGSKQIKLPTGGTPLSLTIGPHQAAEELQFSHKQFDLMQAYAGTTRNQMLKSKAKSGI